MTPRAVRCRLSCELRAAGRSHPGMAVNVSHTGLFVQTRASFDEGSEVELIVFGDDERPDLTLRARVVRVKRVHPGAQAVVARGMTLEVLGASEGWQRLVARLCGRTDQADALPAGDPGLGLPRFRVVLRRSEGIRIRTRIVVVACLSADEARAGVLADVEAGWQVVKVERQSLQPESAPAKRCFRVVAVHGRSGRRWESTFEAESEGRARELASSDLGRELRVLAVALADPQVDAAPAPDAVQNREGRLYQVRARLEEGTRIRTRVAKLRARSPEEAARRVLEELGEGWLAVKVTPL